MASTSGEIPDSTEPYAAAAPNYEQQLIDLLGPARGPGAYQHVLGLLGLLDDIQEPPLSAVLKAYIRDEGIDPKLVVPDGAGGFITAYDTEHANQLRERTRLARREKVFQQVAEIGSAILRAPQ
ncbi:MAG: hypothetical protein ACHQT5_00315 [Candidatus Saccharimonadales bacterium]|jgi:hypothetical protein